MARYILLPVSISAIIFLFYRGDNPSDNPAHIYSEVIKAGKIMDGYDSLLKKTELDIYAFEMAYNAFKSLLTDNKLTNDTLLTIVDYSKPSDKERLYIIDLKNLELVDKSLVAHGQNSGEVLANDFSNQKQSHKSSLGLFLTLNTYTGRHGYSLRIDGLEKGLNDNARKRAIVFHGAPYVSQAYIRQNGRLGRSYGCPAIPNEKATKIINLIKGGSCLYIYHPCLLPKQL